MRTVTKRETFRPYVVLTDYLIYHKKGEELIFTRLIFNACYQVIANIDYGAMVPMKNSKGRQKR